MENQVNKRIAEHSTKGIFSITLAEICLVNME